MPVSIVCLVFGSSCIAWYGVRTLGMYSHVIASFDIQACYFPKRVVL